MVTFLGSFSGQFQETETAQGRGKGREAREKEGPDKVRTYGADSGTP